MPFEIVRNDIVNMQVDAIVNTANPRPIIGYGCDAAIHKKAGPKLLQARKKIGFLDAGQTVITRGYDLNAKYVLHTVGPVWQGGTQNELAVLRQCYDSALQLAWKYRCRSIAFPLLSSGNHGVPKAQALQTAISAISTFLLDHEMQIYLVVFGGEALALSEKLFQSVASYIDETYILDKTLDEYGVTDKKSIRQEEQLRLLEELERARNLRCIEDFEALTKFRHQNDSAPMFRSPMPNASTPMPAAPSMMAEPDASEDLTSLLAHTDAGFSETLLKLIDRSGKKDSVIYKKANVDRKLFSKIRSNPDYRPSKTTALAFAVALELSLEETKEFIGRAGYALTRSSKLDIIVEYFISRKQYNIYEINLTLFEFDQRPLGGCAG